jgi:hypothetical protein
MDPVNQTYWLYSDESIFELIVKNEDRDIWKVYLARKAFEKALSHAHVSQRVESGPTKHTSSTRHSL